MEKAIISKEEIDTFLASASNHGEFIPVHIKVALVIGISVDFDDHVSIKTEDFEFNEVTGIQITYTVSKPLPKMMNSKPSRNEEKSVAKESTSKMVKLENCQNVIFNL